MKKHAGAERARSRGGAGRASWHARANAVVVGYLAAALVALLTHWLAGTRGWLALHLFLLGAVTNAIVIWTTHFAGTLLRGRYRPQPPVAGRLAVLNVGVIGVLVGVMAAWRPVTVAAAAVVTTAVAVQLGSLVRAAWGGDAGRFAPTVRYYWAAAMALLLGVAAGAALTFDLPGDWPGRVLAAHVQLNVFGWIALTVLGTEFTFAPMVLRTRMVSGVETAARHALSLCAAGLALAVAGFLAGTRGLAIAGLVVYLAGVARSLEPFARTVARTRPRSPAAWMLAAASGWLLIAVCADLAAASAASEVSAVADRIESLVPWLVTGFVAQVLIGALHYLLPAVLGRGPAGGRRVSALLDRYGISRAVVFNAGVVVLALPLPAGADAVGWVAIGVVVAIFVVLAAGVLTRALRDTATRTTAQRRATEPAAEAAAASRPSSEP